VNTNRLLYKVKQANEYKKDTHTFSYRYILIVDLRLARNSMEVAKAKRSQRASI